MRVYMTHHEPIPRWPSPGSQASDDLAGHIRWLRALALRLVHDEATADDLAQEAWLTMERAQDSHPSRAAGYLRNLARRRARGESRRAFREKRSARREAIPSAAELAAGLESRRVLLEELQALPAESSELLLLRAQCDMSAADIARAKGLPASTVRDRLQRAEAQLRARLDRRYRGNRDVWASAMLALPAPVRFATGASAGAAVPHSIGAFLGLITTMNATLKTILIATPLALSAWLLVDWGDRAISPELAEAPRSSAEPNLLDVSRLPSEVSTLRQVAGDAAAAGTIEQRPVVLDLIDTATRAPAAWYALNILDSDGTAIRTLETDAKGRVEIPAELSPYRKGQSLRLLAVDHPELHLSEPARLELTLEDLSEDGRAIEWELPVGPSYLLSFEADPPADACAFLSITGFIAHGAMDRWTLVGAPIREGSPPWVRFEPAIAAKATPGIGPWFIRVSDRAGHWQAIGSTATRIGRAPEVVGMVGGPYGLLTARVTVNGSLPTSPVDVSLQRVGEWLGAPHGVRGASVSPKGWYLPGELEQSYLTPGTWTVDLSGDGLVDVRAEVEIRAGETTVERWDLTRASGTHSLRVRLSSESGEAPMRFVSVIARPAQGTDEGISDTKFGADDPDVSRADLSPGERAIRIDGLTPGRWIVELGCTANLAPFEPGTKMAVNADQGELRFICLDREVNWQPTVVELYDATTNEPIQSASVNLWVDSSELVSAGTVGGRTELPAILPGLAYDLAAHAPGYRAVLVTALLRDAAPGRPIRIPMERGWGTLLTARAFDMGNWRPLGSVTVIADGAIKGTTDALGRFLLTAESPPTSLSFECKGWTLLTGDLDPVTGALTTPHQARPTNLMFQKK